MTLQAEKLALRKQLRSRRAAAMRADGAELNAKVCAAISAARLYAAARCVAAYMAFKDEIDLDPLLADDEKLFAVPRIAPDGASLSFHALDKATLVRHRFGQQEPAAGTQAVSTARFDLVLVPGLAFDSHGARLGYGRGYYDRFLAGIPTTVPTVGVSLDELIVAAVPSGAHDVRVTHLVTESGLRAVVQPDVRPNVQLDPAARSKASS